MPKYNSIDTIPAKVYFDIKESNNLQLLKPKPSEKDLDKIFESIDDKFFLRSKNPEAQRYLNLTVEIQYLNYKIATLKSSLHHYYYTETNLEMRKGFAQALLDGYDIVLNTEVPFGDEVHRILTIDVGILKNDLSFLENEYNDMIKRSKGKDFNFFGSIVSLSTILPNNSLLKEEMTLAVYVELSNKAQEIASENERQRIKNKK